jgi:hypothetical protein
MSTSEQAEQTLFEQATKEVLEHHAKTFERLAEQEKLEKVGTEDMSNIGFKKFDVGKLRWHLFPPAALQEVLRVFEFGSKKYGDMNWLNADGVEWTRLYNSLQRHAAKWREGQDEDEESELYELAHLCCNALMLLEYKLQDLGIDNRDHRLGKVFGKLTTLKFIDKDKKHRKYLFNCGHCGNDFEALYNNVQKGNTTSCGCQHYENMPSTHGLSTHRIYNVYRGMLNRCNDEAHISYKNYGGRGVGVCDRWDIFENFLEDMGIPEEGLQLDRLDNDADYSPDNCRWVTPKVNHNNKRTSVKYYLDGIPYTVGELSEKYNINTVCLRKRLNTGWDLMRALMTPSGKKESK